MLAEQQLLNQSQSADFFSEGIFLLGKDLPDEVKKELSTYITDFKGYSYMVSTCIYSYRYKFMF